jgi:hypothetical protein
MKVRTAARTLSSSVAKAIKVQREDGNPDFQHSKKTEEWIQLVNDLFDILNSCDLREQG